MVNQQGSYFLQKKMLELIYFQKRSFGFRYSFLVVILQFGNNITRDKIVGIGVLSSLMLDLGILKIILVEFFF